MTDLYELAKAARDNPNKILRTRKLIDTGMPSNEMEAFKEACTPQAIIDLYERINQLELEAERAGTPPWP